MKIIQVVDLLREKMVQIPAPEKETVTSQEKILLKYEKDTLVAKVISGPRELPGAKVNTEYEFEQKITAAEFAKYQDREQGSFDRVKQARVAVQKLDLAMHVFSSRLSFDEKVVAFFFTATENIDFRQLVKDLALIFKKRIHLQRVSVQDRSRIIGGIGICGRQECCSFMKFSPERATMDAVRDQGIMTKYNERIFGLSGRIKDCFLYERDLYREQRRYFPHIKQEVSINDRKGRVKGLDILNGKVKVSFAEDIIDIFDVSELTYDNKIKKPPTEKKPNLPLEIDINGVGI